MTYDAFTDDIDLLDAVQLEALFKKKPKYTYETIKPKIQPKQAISKAISLLKSELSKSEFIIFKGKIQIGVKSSKYYNYNDFIKETDDKNEITIATYDMEKIVGKFDYEIEDKFYDANGLLNTVINNVNATLNKDGYNIWIHDDSEITSKGFINIQKGAKIRINN